MSPTECRARRFERVWSGTVRRLAVTLFIALTASTAQAEVSLTFGVYTSDKPTAMVRQFRPALSVLEAKMTKILGQAVDIRLQVARSYTEGIEDLVRGKVDFARFGPVSYIEAKAREPGISILAVESNGGSKIFNGIICVREGSDLRTAEDLVGRSFAFGDEYSTIGRYLAQLYLLKHGITANTLGSFSYLDRHDAVGMAVGSGRFDAGALKESTFRKLVARGTPIRPLATFRNVTKPWIAREGLADEIWRALKTALLELDDSVALAALGKDGFLEGSDEDYETIREAMAQNSLFFD